MNGTIVERIGRGGSVYVDSMVIIYFIESHERYLAVVSDLFKGVDRGEIKAFSSYLTLLEVLVRPLEEGRLDLVEEYKKILLNAEGFQLFPINGEIAERGAEIRAHYRFRTPDAVQLATALCKNASVFVTNDRELKKFDQVKVLLLEELVT